MRKDESGDPDLGEPRLPTLFPSHENPQVTDPKRAHAMTRFLTSALLCPVRPVPGLTRSPTRTATPPQRAVTCFFAFIFSLQVYKRAQPQQSDALVHPEPMARAAFRPPAFA